MKVTVRHTRDSDISSIISLQQRVYPQIPPWHEAVLRHQLEVFPQGQIVAELNGELVGAASSLIVMWDEWQVEHTWQEITARGSFNTHNPMGRTLYGAEVFVHPHKRGAGIGRALYQARRQVCRKMNLQRIIACGRLPGYHRYAAQMSAQLYAQKVVWGDIRDPVLSFQLHHGFHFCSAVGGYIPEDLDSLGYAALIVWLNPYYHENKPTRLHQGDIL